MKGSLLSLKNIKFEGGNPLTCALLLNQRIAYLKKGSRILNLSSGAPFFNMCFCLQTKKIFLIHL